MQIAVHKETGEGRKQRAQKSHWGRKIRPWKLMAPNCAVGQGKGEVQLPISSVWLALGETKCAAHNKRYAKVVLLLPTHQPCLPRSRDWNSCPKSTTVASGTWGKLLPHTSPPHTQHWQEHGAFRDIFAHSKRIYRQLGYDLTSQSKNINQVKMETKIMVNFALTQTTLSNILKGLGA